MRGKGHANIYLAAILEYGLGSNDNEEITLYNKFKAIMKDQDDSMRMGVPRNF